MSVGEWVDRKTAAVRRVVRRTVYACGFLVFCLGGASLYGFARPPVRVEHVQVPVEVEKPEPRLEELIEEAPRMGMPKPVALTLLEMEDGGRNRREAKRCEWESKFWLEQANRITKDPEQRDAYRCSYGVFQVAGWHAPKYGMIWADLLDMRNNFEVAATVWGNCFAQVKKANPGADRYRTYRAAFRCYNGSGPAAERYADKAMAKLERMAVNKLLSNMEG